MKAILPKALTSTMNQEIIYNAFLDLGFNVAGLEEIEQLELPQKIDLAWFTIEKAHNSWREQTSTLEKVLDEDFSRCLNAFTRLELAGPAVFNVWADHFQNLFGQGFPLNSAFCTDGYEHQMTKMEELNFEHSPFLSNIFVVERRDFAEKAKLAGIGDLYRYVSNIEEDVLGVIYSTDREATLKGQIVIQKISHEMYYEPRGSLPFRLARQIVLAGGGEPPISW